MRDDVKSLLVRAEAALMVEHRDAHPVHGDNLGIFIEGPWKGHVAPQPKECRICALDMELMDAIHPGWRNP